MSSFYRNFLLPALNVASLGDAERAHEMAIRAISMIGREPMLRIPISRLTQTLGLSKTVLDMEFPNPLGIASGFDKRGIAARGLEAMGFGFVMGGTVVPKSQPGSLRPRIFRSKYGIINRCGFNSEGARSFSDNIKIYGRPSVPYGISVGPNKDTVGERRTDDIIEVIVTVYDYGDFFVVNVSSPNTKDLRLMQERAVLEELLKKVQAALWQLSESRNTRKKPLFVKLSPDMDEDSFAETLEACEQADGIIFGNTTLARPALLPTWFAREAGGYSGPDQFDRTCEGINFIKRHLPEKPLIAVGGAASASDVIVFLNLGADLVKIYGAFILEGPGLPRRITRDMRKYVADPGYAVAA